MTALQPFGRTPPVALSRRGLFLGPNISCTGVMTFRPPLNHRLAAGQARLPCWVWVIRGEEAEDLTDRWPVGQHADMPLVRVHQRTGAGNRIGSTANKAGA
jgi:hypothetical protein